MKKKKHSTIMILSLLLLLVISVLGVRSLSSFIKEYKNEELLTCITEEEVDLIELQRIIDSGADIHHIDTHHMNDGQDDSNYTHIKNATPLGIVISTPDCNNYKEAFRVLLDNGADINYTNKAGINMLHWLIGEDLPDKPERVKFIVENGINIDKQDISGETALMKSVMFVEDEMEMYELLLELGANKDLKDDYGDTVEDKILREEDVVAYYRKKDSNKPYVEKKKSKVAIGMTAEEVRASEWGSPNRINRTTTKYGVKEQWVYSNRKYVYLKNGIVTTIQD